MIKDGFRTPDTSLAAYLLLQKEKYLAIEFEDGQGFFVFENTVTLQGHINRWNAGDNDLRRYYSQYRAVLRLLHSEEKAQKNGKG